MGVFFPLRSEIWFTKNRVLGISAGIIIYSILLTTTVSIKYHRWQQGDSCVLFVYYEPWVVTMLSMHAYITLCLISVIYVQILRESLRLRRKVNVLQMNNENDAVVQPGQLIEEMSGDGHI